MASTVNDFSPFLGQPIRSLQTFLREIGQKYEEMPTVVPDGIYGPQTEASVRWFQEFSALPATGITDKKTWDAVVNEYFIIINQRTPPVCVNILPKDFTLIQAEDNQKELHPIQAMIKNLANTLESVLDLEITGVHDENSVNSVKSIQNILGKEETGIIDKELWNDIVLLYETHVSSPRFQR